MLPSISLRCPSCMARIKAPIQLLGQSRSCPNCSRRFVVRPEVPEDLGPVLASDSAPGVYTGTTGRR